MEFTHQITMGMILNWLFTIGIGVVIFGLIKYTFKREKALLVSKEEIAGHCPKVIKEIMDSRKEDIKEAITWQEKLLDQRFKVLETKIELAVAKGIKAGNSK
jgi:hypothetical protein